MHKEMMKDLFMKKRGMKDEDSEMDSKMKMLEQVSDEAGKEYSDDDMQGVEVMAPSKEGLMEGLDVAEGMLSEGAMEMEGEEHYETVEEIDMRIAELEELKEKMVMEEMG